MQVSICAANDDGLDSDYAALDAAFSVRPTPTLAQPRRGLPPLLVFAAGLVLGVVATILLH